MALTNSGFDGTVNEAQYANMWALGGVDAVSSSGAWAVTQGTGRQVSVAAQSGYAFARGVLSIDSAAITAALGTPANGQWYLIVRRVNWATNTVSVVAIPHTTTSTTVPTVAPGTFPTFNDNPGVLYDHKLAWAWVNSVNTTVTLFDLRTLGLETRIASLVTAGTTNAGRITDLEAGTLTRIQTDTTNTQARTITQMGWGKITGNGTTTIVETVTFPVAFASIPVVTLAYIGYRTPVAAFNLTGLLGSVALTAGGLNPTPTTVNATFTGSTPFGATTDFYYNWTATGVPA